jgi:hypothetical protein
VQAHDRIRTENERERGQLASDVAREHTLRNRRIPTAPNVVTAKEMHREARVLALQRDANQRANLAIQTDLFQASPQVGDTGFVAANVGLIEATQIAKGTPQDGALYVMGLAALLVREHPGVQVRILSREELAAVVRRANSGYKRLLDAAGGNKQRLARALQLGVQDSSSVEGMERSAASAVLHYELVSMIEKEGLVQLTQGASEQAGRFSRTRVSSKTEVARLAVAEESESLAQRIERSIEMTADWRGRSLKTVVEDAKVQTRNRLRAAGRRAESDARAVPAQPAKRDAALNLAYASHLSDDRHHRQLQLTQNSQALLRHMVYLYAEETRKGASRPLRSHEIKAVVARSARLDSHLARLVQTRQLTPAQVNGVLETLRQDLSTMNMEAGQLEQRIRKCLLGRALGNELHDEAGQVKAEAHANVMAGHAATVGKPPSNLADSAVTAMFAAKAGSLDALIDGLSGSDRDWSTRSLEDQLGRAKRVLHKDLKQLGKSIGEGVLFIDNSGPEKEGLSALAQSHPVDAQQARALQQAASGIVAALIRLDTRAAGLAPEEQAALEEETLEAFGYLLDEAIAAGDSELAKLGLVAPDGSYRAALERACMALAVDAARGDERATAGIAQFTFGDEILDSPTNDLLASVNRIRMARKRSLANTLNEALTAHGMLGADQHWHDVPPPNIEVMLLRIQGRVNSLALSLDGRRRLTPAEMEEVCNDVVLEVGEEARALSADLGVITTCVHALSPVNNDGIFDRTDQGNLATLRRTLAPALAEGMNRDEIDRLRTELHLTLPTAWLTGSELDVLMPLVRDLNPPAGPPLVDVERIDDLRLIVGEKLGEVPRDLWLLQQINQRLGFWVHPQLPLRSVEAFSTAAEEIRIEALARAQDQARDQASSSGSGSSASSGRPASPVRAGPMGPSPSTLPQPLQRVEAVAQLEQPLAPPTLAGLQGHRDVAAIGQQRPQTEMSSQTRFNEGGDVSALFGRADDLPTGQAATGNGGLPVPGPSSHGEEPSGLPAAVLRGAEAPMGADRAGDAGNEVTAIQQRRPQTEVSSQTGFHDGEDVSVLFLRAHDLSTGQGVLGSGGLPVPGSSSHSEAPSGLPAAVGAEALMEADLSGDDGDGEPLRMPELQPASGAALMPAQEASEPHVEQPQPQEQVPMQSQFQPQVQSHADPLVQQVDAIASAEPVGLWSEYLIEPAAILDPEISSDDEPEQRADDPRPSTAPAHISVDVLSVGPTSRGDANSIEELRANDSLTTVVDCLRHMFASLAEGGGGANQAALDELVSRQEEVLHSKGITTKDELLKLLGQAKNEDRLTAVLHGMAGTSAFALGGLVLGVDLNERWFQGWVTPQNYRSTFGAGALSGLFVSAVDLSSAPSTDSVFGGAYHGKPAPAALDPAVAAASAGGTWDLPKNLATAFTAAFGGRNVVRAVAELMGRLVLHTSETNRAKTDLALEVGGGYVAGLAYRLIRNYLESGQGTRGLQLFLARNDLAECIDTLRRPKSQRAVEATMNYAAGIAKSMSPVEAVPVPGPGGNSETTWKAKVPDALRACVGSAASLAAHAVLAVGFGAVTTLAVGSGPALGTGTAAVIGGVALKNVSLVALYATYGAVVGCVAVLEAKHQPTTRIRAMVAEIATELRRRGVATEPLGEQTPLLQIRVDT